MIKVVSFKICPFVQRVTAHLEAKNIPYEVEYISLKNKPDWFHKISPLGQVPVIVTEKGISLFESDVIIEFLEDEYGPLNSSLSNDMKANERAWSYQASKHYLSQCSVMRSPTKIDLEQRYSKLRKSFERVEDVLTGDKFFSGEEIGKVDVAWIPLLHRAKILEDHSCYNMLEGLDKVIKWQEELLKLNVVNKSVSSDFLESFSGFYLSEKTYLGAKCDVSSKVDSSCSAGTCC
jgi:glutathione S-transferase